MESFTSKEYLLGREVLGDRTAVNRTSGSTAQHSLIVVVDSVAVNTGVAINTGVAFNTGVAVSADAINSQKHYSANSLDYFKISCPDPGVSCTTIKHLK